jgi:nicotinamidase-related amidase
MGKEGIEKPALLIIDMVKDTFDDSHRLPITPLAKTIIEPINRLIAVFRNQKWPIVFATDAFQENDFLFKGRMKPHSIRGTEGAQVIEELDRQAQDLWLPKPKFSAFFGTDLNEWLAQRGVTLCAVAGISTSFCVLTTAMDALCHDFNAVILEDCTMAGTLELHSQTLNSYRRNPLDPLLRVLDSHHFMKTMRVNHSSV